MKKIRRTLNDIYSAIDTLFYGALMIAGLWDLFITESSGQSTFPAIMLLLLANIWRCRYRLKRIEDKI